MHRLLIPLLACFLLSAPALLRAQVPHEIHYLPFKSDKIQNSPQTPDMMCGNAGTYTFGQFIGSSNDVAPPPIFLCFGDSLLVQHNGDADLSGDPVVGTPPGVAFAFYECPPTAMGPTLQDIIGDPVPPIINPDPCLLPGSANGLYITQAVPNGGGTWFFNSGFLQTNFNGGLPISLFFAPITVDNLANNGYESDPSQPGTPPGPCVNVNTAAAFEVVYLNAITATGIDNNFNNDCIGRFTVRGGYPQYDNNAVYTISITLASNPSVKAIIHTAASQLFHLASVAFSVPQSGLYDVVIEDGKSCPHSFQIDMNVCNPADNVQLIFPDTLVPPGGTICVPVTVQNFSILSASFSIEWDETVLQYNGLQNVSSVIDTVFGPANLNENMAGNGFLGVQIFNNVNPSTIVIPNDSTLFEICFTAVGQLGECSGLGVTNNPTGVAFEDEVGQTLALSVDTGQVCIGFLPLQLTYAVIDTSCLGTATLKITVTGGVEPYEVVVDELPTGPTYPGFIANSGGMFIVNDVGSTNNTPVSYDICVQDNNGNGMTICTSLVVQILRLGAQINFAQQPLCNGDDNGVINAVVLYGGVVVPNPGPNYTYAWSPAVPSPGSPNQTGVGAGFYTLTVTDTSTGCSEVASGSLGQPAPLSSQSIATIPAACSGVCDGTITYEAEGGTPFAGPQYQYVWTYNNTQVSSGINNPIVLTNACAGDYTITITDANGCTFSETVTLSDARSLSITQNAVQNVLCNGQSNGSIAITVMESVMSGSNYTFTWTPSGFTQTGTSPMSTYSNLPAGTYAVLAVDNLGCQIADTIQITEPAVLRVDSLGQINPGCSQPNSGSITVQAFGGTGLGSYTYAWSPSPPANPSSQNQNGILPFGTYTVLVTDANGCTVERQFVLPEPMPPSVSLDSISVKCGSDGELSATSPTGFLYVWADINGVSIDSFDTAPAVITSLMGGDYILKVYDSGGCLATDTVSLGGVIPMSFSDTTLNEPTCAGFMDGQIAIGIQDGIPPYTSYVWAPQPQPNQSVIFNLKAGTYTVTVTDNAGCTLVGTFDLGEPPAIVNAFDMSVTGRVSCFGLCDGSATPIVNYNTTPPTGGIFTYVWNDGSTDSMRVNELCAGLNFVTITDANNCFLVDTVDISTPPQITLASLITTETNCFGDSTGTASITATGGNGGPYTYEWDTGETTSTITGLPARDVTVTITDVDGCENSIDTIMIGQPEQIVLMTSGTNPTCFGGNNGQTSVEVTGGVPGFNYNWEDVSGNNVGVLDMAEMLMAGTYDVTVTDANGCTSITSATIQDPPPVAGDFDDVAPLTCHGDQTILSILSISGGSGGPYKFSVDFGAILDPSFPVSLGGGQHFISYFDVLGCSLTDSLFIPEPSPITVTFNPNVIEVELGATANLEPIITGAAVIGSFSWTNSETLLNADTLSATAYTFQSVTYTLTVQDTFGCSGSGSITVNIDPNRNVYIPNIFIPGNPRGLNDHFNVNVGLGVEVVNFMQVYSRWGELLYSREDFLPNNDNFSEGWDGRFNGDYVNPGVFVYIIEVKFLDGRVLLYRGDVTVVR